MTSPSPSVRTGLDLRDFLAAPLMQGACGVSFPRPTKERQKGRKKGGEGAFRKQKLQEIFLGMETRACLLTPFLSRIPHKLCRS